MKGPLCVLTIAGSGPVIIMVVGSVAVLLSGFLSPPPETETELVSAAGATVATLTLSVMGSYLAPAARRSLGVQLPVPRVQVQLVPLIAVGVIFAGSVSVTVTTLAPSVSLPPVFVTVMV